MTDEIRRALDARLSALEGSGARRARIRAQATQEQEEPLVKRKLSMAVALAIALMIALGGIAAAEIAGLNLFGYFARNTSQEYEHWDIEQQKLDNLQEQSTLISTSNSPLEMEALEGYIQLHDAYYDGDVLFLSTITSGAETGRVMVEWTPAEEELAGHEPEKWPIYPREESPYEQEQPFIDAFNSAQENRQPYGYKVYHYASSFADYWTVEGTRLWGIGSRYMQVEGEKYHVEQMQAPLPEEIRQKEVIEIELTMPITVEYRWFDGEKHYYWSETNDPVVATATIARSTDAEQRHYQSEPVMLGGVAVTAEATVSPYLAHVIFHAEEPIFLSEADEDGKEVDPWSVSVVADGTGDELDIMMKGLRYRRWYGPEESYVFYEQYSEDGLSGERYVSLTGDIPASLILTLGKEGAEQATFVLTPVD